MKRFLSILAAAFLFASCGSQRMLVVPRAVNTINTAAIEELNLERGDYEVLNTISAEASIFYWSNKSGTRYEIIDEQDEFSLKYDYSLKKGWFCKFSGILKLGYLSGDYAGESANLFRPEDVARRLAIYRLINEAQQYGTDVLIAPTVATNVEQVGDRVIFKSTATAKIVKIKTDN